MRKLILVMVLAAAAAALACGRNKAPENPPAAAGDASLEEAASPAGQKKTWIYFTKNHNRGTGAGQYDTDCIGTVGTETIGAQRGYKVMWQVKSKNGGNDDDKCDGLNMANVNLRFQTDVMGAMVMKKLTANSGGVIQGTVSREDDDIGSLAAHKYQVYIGNTPAGPDPILVLGCGSCGLPPTD